MQGVDVQSVSASLRHPHLLFMEQHNRERLASVQTNRWTQCGQTVRRNCSDNVCTRMTQLRHVLPVCAVQGSSLSPIKPAHVPVEATLGLHGEWWGFKGTRMNCLLPLLRPRPRQNHFYPVASEFAFFFLKDCIRFTRAYSGILNLSPTSINI